MRYRKVEAVQELNQSIKKERDNVALTVISKILKSSHMVETFAAALECHEREECRPVTMQDFTRLRDVLILKLMIVSLKRAMEFCEFTLTEYAEMERRQEPHGHCYVIKVANHKTAKKGT